VGSMARDAREATPSAVAAMPQPIICLREIIDSPLRLGRL
jgi:hypothetical protein